MNTPTTLTPLELNRYADEKEIARLTGRSVAALRLDRQRGGGIPFSRCGRSVRYKIGDALEFMAARRIAR